MMKLLSDTFYRMCLVILKVFALLKDDRVQFPFLTQFPDRVNPLSFISRKKKKGSSDILHGKGRALIP